jgi:glycosyltransferase involved in cell wall biosynthesis
MLAVVDRRFAFVTVRDFSGTNAKVRPLLESHFPELACDHFDIPSWVRSERRVLWTNLLRVATEFGPARFLDRRQLWGAFWRTDHIFAAVRDAMVRRVAAGGYEFTFQTQSLFDASVDGVPHFVYTDNTAVAAAESPEYPPVDERWQRREHEIYEHAAITFTMSGNVARSLSERYGIAPDRVRCVGAGSNVELAASSRRDPDYAGQGIVFVAREWELKGGPELLEAFAAVRRRHPEATLTIVGCSPPVGSPEGVIVRGWRSHAEVGEALLRASIFCLPTRREAFGIAFIEALAHGLPVVATSLGAIPEFVEHGSSGYLIPPGDVGALTEALDLLLGDPERRRRFGQHGRRVVEQRYTWPRAVEAIAEGIRSVIGPANVAAGHRPALESR